MGRGHSNTARLEAAISARNAHIGQWHFCDDPECSTCNALRQLEREHVCFVCGSIRCERDMDVASGHWICNDEDCALRCLDCGGLMIHEFGPDPDMPEEWCGYRRCNECGGIK